MKKIIFFGLICNFLTTQGISFEESMHINKDFKPSYCINNKKWRGVKQQYKKYESGQFTPDNAPRIPLIIHQIWLGSPFPEKYRAFQESWKKFHPTWEYKIWTEKEVDEFGLKNRKAYEATKNYGERADIVRYEILERIGGLYADADFECLQPFDALHYTLDFYTGISYNRTKPDHVRFYNGLIGSIPHHPIMQQCVNNIKRPANARDVYVQIIFRTGPDYFSQFVIKHILEKIDRTVAFPMTYFYAFPTHNKKEKNREKIFEKWVKEESMALHYWGENWIKPNMIH